MHGTSRRLAVRCPLLTRIGSPMRESRLVAVGHWPPLPLGYDLLMALPEVLPLTTRVDKD